MNWYFEKDGISQGPLSEEALVARLRAAELNADSLIWHTGLEDWQALRTLRPDWLDSPAPATAGNIKPVAKANTPPRKAGPRAPTELPPPTIAVAPPPAPAAKPGLLKRWFGIGKDK